MLEEIAVEVEKLEKDQKRKLSATTVIRKGTKRWIAGQKEVAKRGKDSNKNFT